MHNRGNVAVSEVFSYIMVVTIVTIATALVFLWYGPYMQEIEAETQINSIAQQFDYLNDAIYDLISQGVNSSKIVPISINEGSIYINPINTGSNKIIGERIVIFYSLVDSPEYKFYVDGLDDVDSEILINLTGSHSCDIQAIATRLNDSYILSNQQNVAGSSYSTFNFGSGNNIAGSFKIDLINDTNSLTFGRIFVFDTGSVVYELNTAGGIYHAGFESAAVVKGYPSSSYINTKPLIFDEYKNFVFHIVEFNSSTQITGGSGKGDYKLSVKSEGSSILANRNETYNLRMQFFNNDYSMNADAWRVFFNIYHNFKNDAIFQKTIYRNGNDVSQLGYEPLYFTVVRTVCDVSLGV